MQVAERIDRAYAQPASLAALTVSGSVGWGVADRWSDLELDCYWLTAPSDADRRAPIERAGGVLMAFWDYDEDDDEWSEDYRIGELQVTVSNFTVSTIEAFLTAVVANAEIDPVKHMRLPAIQRCRPLRGNKHVASWQARAGRYPDLLVDTMVKHALDPMVLAGWAARDALVERGDEIALDALLAAIEHAVTSALLALNRTYRPHRTLKWQHHLLASLAILPERFEDQLRQLWVQDRRAGLDAAERLLAAIRELAERHSSAELTDFTEAFSERRRALSLPDRDQFDP